MYRDVEELQDILTDFRQYFWITPEEHLANVLNYVLSYNDLNTLINTLRTYIEKYKK